MDAPSPPVVLYKPRYYKPCYCLFYINPVIVGFIQSQLCFIYCKPSYVHTNPVFVFYTNKCLCVSFQCLCVSFWSLCVSIQCFVYSISLCVWFISQVLCICCLQQEPPSVLQRDSTFTPRHNQSSLLGGTQTLALRCAGSGGDIPAASQVLSDRTAVPCSMEGMMFTDPQMRKRSKWQNHCNCDRPSVTADGQW